MVIICTTSFTKILRPAHTAVFMCSVWISEQTAIISLYSINWLVFKTETECVYCAVRTEYITYIITGFNGRSVASLSPRSQGFDLRPIPMIFVVEKVAHGQVLLPTYFGVPPQIVNTYLHLSTALIRTSDKAWEPPEALSFNGKRPPQNSFHIVCCPSAVKRKPQLRSHPDATLLATIYTSPLALELGIYSFAHNVCKMWIFYEPRRVILGNTRHIVEE